MKNSDAIDYLKKVLKHLEELETREKSLKNLIFNTDIYSLLASPMWPEAVPQFLICENNEEDKNQRAEGILDYFGISLEDKKFLDFGCGEGHVAKTASLSASFSAGFDLIKTGNLSWEMDEKCLLTTDFEKIIKKAPYDIICLYDVLDHATDAVELLKRVRLLCSSKTKIFVRCHPWAGRWGSHLYKQINKAWIHIFFTKEELETMGYKMEYIYKTYFPLDTQKEWFLKSGFKIESQDMTTVLVEQFFQRPELMERLPKEYKSFPEWQMSQLFNDYVISTGESV